MTYDFSTPTPREHTDSVSLDMMAEATGRADLIPLWVADMDFPTPPFVVSAIERRLEQKILGYTCAPAEYYESIRAWNERRFAFRTPRETIHYVPGIVPAIYFAENCFTSVGDGVMSETPVYFPFHNVTAASGRRNIEVPLLLRDGRYYHDYAEIERRLPECRMFILCNPHNPGGRSWTAEEIAQIARLCKKYGVVLVSDEIHADMTFAPARHVCTATTCPEAEDVTITMMAPTKAFNLPGVVASHTIVINPTLRRRFFAYLDGNDIGLGNVFAYDSVRACYSAEGEEWLSQMLDYVAGNIKYVSNFLASHCPKINAMQPEASFLVFLDCRELGFASSKELADFFISGAGLYLNEGAMFGAPGSGFMRLNVGQPRCTLERAMRQLAAAYAASGF